MTKDNLDVTEAQITAGTTELLAIINGKGGGPRESVIAIWSKMQSAREPKPAYHTGAASSMTPGDHHVASISAGNSKPASPPTGDCCMQSPCIVDGGCVLLRCVQNRIATLQPAKENSYERSIAAASTDDLDEIEPVVAGLRAYAQGRLLVLSVADLRVAARHTIAALQPADPVGPKVSSDVVALRAALDEIAQPVVCPPRDLDEAFAQREAIRDIARSALGETL